MGIVKRPLLIAAIAGIAALLALGAWWWSTHERVEAWVDLPQRGEVTWNPLYVLALALENDRVDVIARQRLDLDRVELAADDTMVLLSDPFGVSDAQEQALMEWVDRGGHLVMRTPAPDTWRIAPGQRSRASAAAPILRKLDVVAHDGDPQCEELLVDGEESHVEFCDGRRFDVADATRVRWEGEGGGHVFARLRPRGARGSVDVVADLDFLTNEKLMDGPHVALTRQLLAPNYREGRVHLVYDAQLPSLWALLMRHGWMAWLPLALLLAAWLWSRAQRFGPLLPSPAVERRSLMEHVIASGEHLHRYGHAHLLHQSVREAFLSRLRRKDPQAAALEGEPQAALIADRLQRPRGEVRDALASPPAGDHAAFRSRVATLIRMRNQL